MAHRMLRHKAAIQGIRYAFGFSGIMEPDEAESIAVREPATPEPRAVQQLPPLSEAEYQRLLPSWRTAIESGRKSATDVLGMMQTKWAITDGQADAILALGATVAPDGEIIDAVPATVGDAWEPPVETEGGN
jgi:hypothetical protein